jgi:predicted HTH transcriptional regulator
MFRQNLEGITEQDLHLFVQNQTPESLTVEFKGELNLDRREDKAEAAKDVSAMANTAGGRIFYGLAEETLPDGSKVAGTLNPLTDGAIDSRLEDVLLSSIHPRPRFGMTKVPISGGRAPFLVPGVMRVRLEKQVKG